MSRFRTLAHRWVPPALLSSTRAGSSRQYSSYEEASKERGSAYDVDSVLESTVADKTRVAHEQLQAGVLDLSAGSLSIFAALAMARTDRPLRVLDFGGAAGYHYFLAKAMSPSLTSVAWHVVETETMARAASDLQSNELRFYTSISDAVATWNEPPDLVFASGVFQYLPEPLRALRDIVVLRARIVFITRTGLSAAATPVVTVQRAMLSSNGPGPLPRGVEDRTLAYPVVFAPRVEFENILTANYNRVTRILEEPGTFGVSGVAVENVGYICASPS